MIVCRSQDEIEQIAEAGKITAEALSLAEKAVLPGITTAEIDSVVEKYISAAGAAAAFKGYRGYPAATCISIDEEVVHGIPGKKKLKSGQLVGIDVGVELNGYYADAAKTFVVGTVSADMKKLLAAGKEALKAGIKAAVCGRHLYGISAAIEKTAAKNGYSVVRDYVGHGIGKAMHEEPQIPNFSQPSLGPKLKPGMVLALEPMLNMGTHGVEVLSDNWTVVTKDRLPSVHFEHTVAITSAGPRILTK